MPFDLQPTLDGQLVKLRPLLPNDWDALYAAASDPLIWEQHPASDRYKEEVFRVYFQEGLECGGAFAVLDARTGQIIGSTRFFGYSEKDSAIEIGWTFLARSYWGGHYNGEMKRLLCEHAFRFVDTVILLVGTTNFRSQRAVEKIGGVRVGSRPAGPGRENFIYHLPRLAPTNRES